MMSLEGHPDFDQEESKLLISDAEIVYEISKSDPLQA